MMRTSDGRAWALTVGLVLVEAILWLVWLAGMLVYVPHAERTFRDFNMKVPVATEQVLAASQWLVNYWYVLILFLPVFLAADALLDFFLRREARTRRLAWVWAVLMLALPLGVILLSWLALWAAQVKLLEGLSR